MPTLLYYFQRAAARPEASAVVVALALLLAALALFAHWRPWRAHLRPRRILSANETEFFYRLCRSLPKYHVFAQVSFSALITVDGRLSERQRFDVRRRFGWKYADFVVCQRGSLYVLAVIELDDRTHQASADRQRDATLAAAGYRIIRFQSKHKPTEEQIAGLFKETSTEASPT